MAAAIRIEAAYAEDPDAVFRSAVRYDELAEAMQGIAAYEGLPPGEAQEGQTFDVTVTFWGWMKNPPHTIHVETRDDAARLLQSREHGGWIKRWDHRLQVLPDERGARWVDEIVIDGGWRTFTAAMFARYVYTTRHKARNALEITARNGKAAS